MDNSPKQSGVNWTVVVIIAIIIIFGGWYLLSGESGIPLGEENNKPASLDPSAEPPPTTVLRIKAEAGRFTPSEVSVKRGERVIIEFTAVDDKYDFSFVDPKIGFDVITEPGTTQAFGFETGELAPGHYQFECFEFCPFGEMTGMLEIRS